MPRATTPKGEMAEIVQRVLHEAKRRSGKSADLAKHMAPLLGGSAPKDSSISSWMSGRDRPSAEALLAAAKASGVSIDEYLYDKTLRGRLEAVEAEVEALRGRLDQLVGGLRQLIEPAGSSERS